MRSTILLVGLAIALVGCSGGVPGSCDCDASSICLEGVCYALCNSASDCDPCHVCSEGACQPASCGTVGASCQTSADCSSDTAGCFSGVCCASACDGPCVRCDAAGSEGSCAPLMKGASCGVELAWDGAGACVDVSTPDISIASQTSCVAVNDTLMFSSTNNGGEIDTYAWSFGDGASSSASAQATHSYNAPGVYPVQLNVSGPGGTDMATLSPPVRVIDPGWSTIELGGAPCIPIRHLWRDPQNSDRLWVGGSNRIALANITQGSWQTFTLEGTLNALHGSSSDNVWFAGESGLMVQWDGTTLIDRSQGLPTNTNWYAVHAHANDAVWVGGLTHPKTHIYFWNGQTWQKQWEDEGGYITGLDGIDGTRLVGSVNASAPAVVYTENGLSWTRYNHPSPINAYLRDVVVASKSPLVAYASGQGVLMRFEKNGGTITFVDEGPAEQSSGQYIFSLTRAGSSLWGVGPEAGLFTRAASWAPMTLPNNPLQNEKFYAVYAAGANELWLAGDEGAVYRYGGAGWVQVGHSYSCSHVNRVWSDGTDLAMVGSDEMLAIMGGASYHREVNVNMYGVFVLRNDYILAVGDSGHVWRFDGTAWTKVDVPTTNTLQAVWAFDEDDIYIVGNQVILHFDGVAWNDESAVLPSNANLWTVWGDDPDQVWAGGQYVLMRKDAGVWAPVRHQTHPGVPCCDNAAGDGCPDCSVTLELFRSISGSSATDVRIVGAALNYGYVKADAYQCAPNYRCEITLTEPITWTSDGTSVTEGVLPSQEEVYSTTVVSPTEHYVWAQDGLHLWNGDEWRLLAEPVNPPGQRHIFHLGPGDVWVPNGQGTITRWQSCP